MSFFSCHCFLFFVFILFFNELLCCFLIWVRANRYDALLGSGDNWEEFCLRGVLHGGDSDSTAIIGGCWFGALYGFKNVPKINWEGLEKLEILAMIGEDLYEAAKK